MKKTPTDVERKERWQRYGRIGQSRYAIVCLTGIMEDTAMPISIRKDAMHLRDKFQDFMIRYKEQLNVKS